MPTQAYRSSGRPEVTFAIERLVDIAARELGFDRFELRRKNIVRPEAMPYTNPVGMIYDSGATRNMDAGMRLADWDGFPARKREVPRAASCSASAWPTTWSPRSARRTSRREITVTPEAGVEVVIGTQPSGQGHETSFAQVAADLLGVPFEWST